MTIRSRSALLVHNIVLRMARGPLRHLWAAAYWAIARAGAAYLTRGAREPSAYTRGSVGTGDLLPGLSDVDLTIVLGEDPGGPLVARRRATERWQRLRRALPPADLLLDYPRVFEGSDLLDLDGASAPTYGLDDAGEPRAAYFPNAASGDRVRMLERPGLYGQTADWRLLTGPDRRPPERERDAQERRIAAWLELSHWWQYVPAVCIEPGRPRSAHLCLKLVTEPARIWLWLAFGERASGRVDVLERARRRLPEEEDGLRLALDLDRSLHRSPEAPLHEVLPVLVRFSKRIADLIEGEVAPAGVTEVRLAAGDSGELVHMDGEWPRSEHRPAFLPLCDWRALVCDRRPDRAFALLPGDPGDPKAVAEAAESGVQGPYPALRSGGVLVLPAAERWRSRMRAIACAATDPVSLALADGAEVARFPNVRGWSAEDIARRALAEHRLWVAAEPVADGDVLGRLITAARAALFSESLAGGSGPQLPLTVAETLRQLASRSPEGAAIAADVLDAYRDYTPGRSQPPAAIVSGMRDLIHALPGYH